MEGKEGGTREGAGKVTHPRIEFAMRIHIAEVLASLSDDSLMGRVGFSSQF